MSDVYSRLVKDGQDKNRAIKVTFFRHLKRTDKGTAYTWNLGHTFSNFEQMRVQLAQDITGSTGPARKVYTVSGKPITSLEQLEDGGVYVCCGGEPFTDAGVPPAAKGGKAVQGVVVAAGGGEVEVVQVNKEDAAAMIDADIKGQQTIVCYFFGAAGQAAKSHKGGRLVVNPTRYKKFEQLLGDVRGKVSLHTGPVQKLYDLEGNEITAVSDLKDQGRYICSIPKKFSPAMISDAAKAPNPPGR